MDPLGFPGVPMEFPKVPCSSRGFPGSPTSSREFPGIPWKSLEVAGVDYKSISRAVGGLQTYK